MVLHHRRAQEAGAAGTVEQAFPLGGLVHMDLTAGTYTLRGGATDGKIHVRWHTTHGDKGKVTLDVHGPQAILRATGPSSYLKVDTGDFAVDIDVPSHVDLEVRMSAGELKIQNIQGNKDLEGRVGSIQFTGDPAANYQRMDASVRSGEIKGLEQDLSGFFRSMKWKGPGPYQLHAHLGIGDITLPGAEKKLPASAD